MSDELPDCDPTAVAYGEGYQQAIADVVSMIGEQFDAPHIADVAGRIAQEITRRFGKDA